MTVNSVHSDLEQQFQLYMRQFNKTYSKGSKEYEMRYANFKDSMERIEKWTNSHKNDSSWQHLAKFGFTKFSDMSSEEFHNTLLKHQSNSTCSENFPDQQYTKKKSKQRRKRDPVLPKLPLKHDWRDRGIITSVKNQRNCGACWAFSTVETIESMHALATGELVELSVQQMIDCALNGNMGCLGGDTCLALSWLALSNTSLVREHDYPLQYRKEYCTVPMKEGIRISANYTCYNLVQKEETLQDLLVNHGPVTVAVDAAMWQDYLGGIIRYHCETTVNHAAQIVGYDMTGPVPYYIIRNSWGMDFGVDGYIYVEMGKNLCGIAREVSTVDVLS